MSKSKTAAIADIYNSRSCTYDADNNSLHVRQTQTYISHLLPYLGRGTSLLDLACGTGLLTIPIKSHVGTTGRVVGVDVSRGMLDLARRKPEEQFESLDVEWYEHDVSDLTALDLGSKGGFDIITCAAALVLLPDPSMAIKNWTTLLKPGGRMMTDVVVPESNVVMEVFISIGPGIGETLKWDMTRFRTQGDLCKVLEAAGLVIEKIWESEVYESNKIDVENAEELFDGAVKSPMFANFGTAEIKETARTEFVRKLQDLGGLSGKIREDTRSWMCIARKPI